MGAAKAVGGILALAGSALVLLLALDMIIGLGIFTPGANLYSMAVIAAWMIEGDVVIYIQLVIAIVGLVGAIVGFAKKAGGALALIAGVIWLIGGFVGLAILWPLSALGMWTGQLLVGANFISIEAILCLVGGILILASGSD